MAAGSHRQLIVWQKSVELAKQAVRATDELPAHHRWGLGSQISRAAISVPANIAEGAAKGPGKEFLRGLRIARGSLAELETHVLVASDLGYLSNRDELLERTANVEHMLNALISVIARKLRKES